MKSLFIRSGFTAIFIAVSILGPAQTKNYKALSDTLNNVRQAWDVPGMAVAIVKDGEVVYNEGFGELEIEQGKKPNGESVFAIASISKAFTAAALAMLVDEGKISWDDKVVDYLKYFKLYDPWVTQQFTIADLLCHRSGLKTFSGDLLWYGTTHSREEVVKRAQYLEPTFGFRDGYGYQNIMYIAAGLVIEEVTGQKWEEVVQKRILDPLEMERTYTSVSQLEKVKNVAQPHSGMPGENIPIDYVNWDNVAPAGALLSCTEDLSKWMTLQMNKGIHDEDTLFTAARSSEMWTVHNPQAVSPFAEKTYKGMTFSGYGLGWQLNNYRGEKIVHHGGGYDGMISKLTMIPGQNTGFVILTNSNTALSHILHYTLLDFILGGDGSDKNWSEMFMPFIEENQKQENQRVQTLMDSKSEKPNYSLPLEDYSGTYGGDMYGELSLTVESDTLRFQFEPTPIFNGWLEPLNNDTFVLHWDGVNMLPVGTAQFIVNHRDEAEEVKIVVPNPDFYFEELEFKRINDGQDE